MKALTVRQPWAWAIAIGAKTVENRSRLTKHRGPLAIHAGAAWDHGSNHDDVFRTYFNDYRYGHDKHLPVDPATYPDRFVFRAVIAIVDVVDCHPAADCCRPWGHLRGFHWALGNVRKLDEPIQTNGRLGLWDIELPVGAP